MGYLGVWQVGGVAVGSTGDLIDLESNGGVPAPGEINGRGMGRGDGRVRGRCGSGYHGKARKNIPHGGRDNSVRVLGMAREDSVGIFGMATPESCDGRVDGGIGRGEERHKIELGMGEDSGAVGGQGGGPGGEKTATVPGSASGGPWGLRGTPRQQRWQSWQGEETWFGVRLGWGRGDRRQLRVIWGSFVVGADGRPSWGVSQR